jgi:DNA-binding NtrC family response regulator
MASDQDSERLHVCVIGGEALAQALPGSIDGRELQVDACPTGEALLSHMAGSVPDAVLMDVKHATGKESLLEKVLGHYHDLPVIVLGDDPAVETVVECIKKRADDFVPLRKAAETLPAKILDAAQRHRLLVEVNQLLEVYNKGGGKLGGMVGVSSSMHELYATIKSIANTDATVLITGESGTGKEMVAEAIHALSALGTRSEGEFVAVNCAAIPKDLLESELFGHEKGSFTGAERQRIGSCERADRGTLFLDEICEMNIGLQSKLLRFLQNHTFVRVGGTEEFTVDTRVIAATNRDPLQEIEKNTLRNDLYYRLNVVPIHVLPLRERPEDIPVLAEHFLRQMCEKYQKYFFDFSPETMRLLLSYPWPGNVRELRNTLERIVVLATSDRVTPDLFPERVRKAADGKEVPKVDVEKALSCVQKALQSQEFHPESNEVLPFDEVEKRAILGAIKKCSGDISKAARKLGLSRATLYRKLDRYGVR